VTPFLAKTKIWFNPRQGFITSKEIVAKGLVKFEIVAKGRVKFEIVAKSHVSFSRV